MPITLSQALDLPVVVVLLMFIPIGLWRGALREWVACAGIALGILLAHASGTRWGDEFARLANMDSQLGSFTVATGFFLTSVLLIGYGGGVALPYRPDLSRMNRGLGALLGLGNGFLIIGGLLRLMQEFLFDGRANSPLHTAALTAFLIDASIAWVYLGLFLALLLCVILGLVRRVNGGTPLLEEYSPSYSVTPQGDRASTTRWDPQPFRLETPSAETIPGVSSAPVQETQLLRLVPTPTATPDTAPANGKNPQPARTNRAASQVANLGRPAPPPTTTERSRHTELVPLGSEQTNTHDGPTLIPRPLTNTTTAIGKPQERAAAPAESATSTANCPICGAPLAPPARFCSNCGHITGTSEQRQIAR